MSYTVAIVGRPNVGKSTLYNRLIGRREAIVDNISGVTRDRKYGESHWNGKKFNVIDTGGFVANSEDLFEAAIREQVAIAIEEASLIIFMADVTTGITDLDSDMAQLLYKTNKRVLLVVNKVDNHERLLDASEFYGLGFEYLFAVSSMSGSGTGELLDAIAETIPDSEKIFSDDDIAQLADSDNLEEQLNANANTPKALPRIAVIGQPNVGKSSLINALVGTARNIVTPIAGTTRDTTDTYYNMFDKEFILVDTAGIRKKAKVHENLEFYSVMRAIKAMDSADVCLLMIDATMGIESQDLNIFRLAVNKRKGIIILVNKWDLVEKETNTARDYEAAIKRHISPFSDVPIIFVSAKEKVRLLKAIEIALDVCLRRTQKIATSKLNELMLAAIERNHPPAVRGNFVQIKYCSQLPTATPAFAFFCNYPKAIKEPYRNYLENQLRQNFDFSGVPISIYFRQK